MLKEIQTAKLSEDRKEGHSTGRAQWWKMYVSMHTKVTHIVSMCACMYYCFKMKWIFYNVFVREPVALDPTLVIYRGNWT